MRCQFRYAVFAVGIVISLNACSYTFNEAGSGTGNAEKALIADGTVKPELDYSSDAPDCKMAAQRITDNLQVGMTLGEVKRLVGQPRVILPGSWYWTPGFNNEGYPAVRYPFGPAEDNVRITSFSADTSRC